MATQIELSLFSDPIAEITHAHLSIKDVKSKIREMEKDFPMELEDKMLALKDLRKQVKDEKDEFLKNLREDSDYYEMLELLEKQRENLAVAKEDLFRKAVDNGGMMSEDLDLTVIVEGAPVRLQSQKDFNLYLNGKALQSIK